MRMLNLCDGYGGFSLALESVGVRTVCRVERDSYAASVLAARMLEGRLADAPIWDDLTTFDGSAWRGFIEIVSAGFPCQPFSAAGRGRGVDDDRWLWPTIGRIIRDVGPRCVFLENVPGLVRAGLPHVLADLADLGFDAEWGLLSASDVGAPHRRRRFWLLAHANDNDGGWREQPWRTDACGTGTDVGNARSPRRPEVTIRASSDEGPDGWQPDGRDLTDGAGQDVADPEGARRDIGRGQAVEPSTIRRRGTPIGGFPPRPDDADGWRRWIAADGPEPSLRRGPDGRPVGLADALHLGGNGLVPLAAATAFAQLVARLDQ